MIFQLLNNLKLAFVFEHNLIKGILDAELIISLIASGRYQIFHIHRRFFFFRWNRIKHTYALSLIAFENMPILAVPNNGKYVLVIIAERAPIVYQ